ncbi:MAG: hypothetical protein K2X91_14115, partial [Thermoleophilia bacterium]|nr:hypothetical protein [Thermoleophilia bacterium]
MELPDEAPVAEEPDYAAQPSAGPDASSILSELSDAPPHRPGDSSGIRLESPGLSRTLEGGAGDQFDITLLDEPVPADLEAAAPGSSDVESTDWDQQAGSDLFAERRTAPPVGARDEGRVNPVDPNIVPDDPSLTSDPQSIFSGVRGGDGSSTSIGSGSVRIGAPSDPNLTAERGPARPPAVPPHKAKPSSAELQLPPPVKPGDSGNIGFDFDADDADANVSRAASPSELMNALKDDSAEAPTREKPAAPVADGSGPSASVDWMAGSNEEDALRDEPAARRAEKAKEKAPPAKPAPKRALASDAGSAEAAPAKPKPRRTERADTDETAPVPKQKRESRSLLVGALLGGLLAGGAFAGAYF